MLYGFSFRRSEQNIVQAVIAARRKNQQVVLEIPLPFCRFVYQFETVHAGSDDFIGDRMVGDG